MNFVDPSGLKSTGPVKVIAGVGVAVIVGSGGLGTAVGGAALVCVGTTLAMDGIIETGMEKVNDPKINLQDAFKVDQP